MSAHHRNKGAGGEREVQAILNAHGIPAKRTFSQIAGDRPDLSGTPGYAFECKRVKQNISVWACIEQAERQATPDEIPVLAFRRDRGQWYAAIPLEHLAELLEQSQTKGRKAA